MMLPTVAIWSLRFNVIAFGQCARSDTIFCMAAHLFTFRETAHFKL